VRTTTNIPGGLDNGGKLQIGRAGKAGRRAAIAARKALAMAAVPAPGPDDHITLSSREKKILASIENELDTDDPVLALRMAWRVEPRKPRRRALIYLKWVGLLTSALLIIVTSVVLIPASGWATLALLTVFFGLPWLVLSMTERHNHD
jgi:hypothetical protein